MWVSWSLSDIHCLFPFFIPFRFFLLYCFFTPIDFYKQSCFNIMEREGKAETKKEAEAEAEAMKLWGK